MTTYHSISKTLAEGYTEPVSLADAKQWLKIDYNDDDAVITRMITSARESVELYTNLALIKSDVVVVADTDKNGKIRLPFINSISVVEVKDEDDTMVVTDSYTLRGSYLTIDPTGYYSITYSVDPVVPASIQEAILMEVAQRYTDRGENRQGSGLSEAAKQKANPHKIIWL